jgi:hypothetical protein
VDVDRTVTAGDRPGHYDVGRANWETAWVPDVRDPERCAELGGGQVIDVVVLGDGYEKATDFEAQLEKWIDDFYAVNVYSRFHGAFRVRAAFTASKEPASSRRRSHYAVKLDGAEVASDEWPDGDGDADERFRRALAGALDRFELNRRTYPRDLDVGEGDELVIHNRLAGLYRNLVVCLLVRTAEDENAGGRTRDVPVGDDARLNVAFGAYSLHELGHAFAYLEDEYIGRRGSVATRRNPEEPSLFTLSNLTFSAELADALWLHLSPWGAVRRQAVGDEPSPVVGWLWRGGEQDRGVWHSEYRCLMNGRHENYAFTADAADEGASLRWPHDYCLWCEEIVAARILEKTGQIGRRGDPEDVNERGRVWHERWVRELRDLYWEWADLLGKVEEREAAYAELGIWRSDLYTPFRA